MFNYLQRFLERRKLRKYLRYTRLLRLRVEESPDEHTCFIAGRIDKAYREWYGKQLDKYFRSLGMPCSAVPFHQYARSILKTDGAVPREVLCGLRLDFIDKLIRELECPPTP